LMRPWSIQLCSRSKFKVVMFFENLHRVSMRHPAHLPSRTYMFSNPRGPLTMCSGVCPPWNPTGGPFPCCPWPLCPRPDVFPLPDAGPRPRRIFFLYAPALSEMRERIEAWRAWRKKRAGADEGGAREGRGRKGEEARRADGRKASRARMGFDGRLMAATGWRGAGGALRAR
jgi:hypothetical protein